MIFFQVVMHKSFRIYFSPFSWLIHSPLCKNFRFLGVEGEFHVTEFSPPTKKSCPEARLYKKKRKALVFWHTERKFSSSSLLFNFLGVRQWLFDESLLQLCGKKWMPKELTDRKRPFYTQVFRDLLGNKLENWQSGHKIVKSKNTLPYISDCPQIWLKSHYKGTPSVGCNIILFILIFF